MLVILFAVWVGAVIGFVAHALCLMARDKEERHD